MSLKQLFCKHDYRPMESTFLPSFQIYHDRIETIGHRESINFKCKKCGKETCDWFMPKEVVDRIKETKIIPVKKKPKAKTKG